MTDKTEVMKLTDFSMDLFSSITRHIINYCIGFVRVEETDNGEDAILIGSGTLVNFNGNECVLTAQHVIDALPKSGNLGFVVSERLHKYVLDVQTVSTIKIGKGEDDQSGPDLGIMVLPQTLIGH